MMDKGKMKSMKCDIVGDAMKRHMSGEMSNMGGGKVDLAAIAKKLSGKKFKKS